MLSMWLRDDADPEHVLTLLLLLLLLTTSAEQWGRVGAWRCLVRLLLLLEVSTFTSYFTHICQLRAQSAAAAACRFAHTQLLHACLPTTSTVCCCCCCLLPAAHRVC
jgi:hypothetical protein